ncbi:MAG TPA: TRAP transporter substrate-binding protein DctP [Pelomicrobium sp.]|nr:TRAP transporter substrate-binding protein DctP [Pelomicrobium sp.]
MDRRGFLKKTAAGAAAGSLGFPMIASAQSGKTFNWKMTTTWPAGSPFYQSGPGSAESFAKKCEVLSGGRLKIKVFAAGELLPAFEGFDACSAGTVEMNHGVAYYWSGKTFAAQYFGTVPFGMSYLGQHAWLWEGGGMALWEEVYKPFGLKPLPVGCTNVQMTGWFKKPVGSVNDFKGLKMRIPGLAGKVYATLGVDVKLLPGGEIFPALERGVIDAAEWVGPFLDQKLGLQNAAKFYYTTGWHEPSTTSEIVINQKAWDSLPEDLKQVMIIAAQAVDLEGILWLETKNSVALAELVEKDGVKVSTLPPDVVKKLKEATADTLSSSAAKDPVTKKVHEAYFAFKKKHDVWAKVSETNFATQARDI